MPLTPAKRKLTIARAMKPSKAAVRFYGNVASVASNRTKKVQKVVRIGNLARARKIKAERATFNRAITQAQQQIKKGQAGQARTAAARARRAQISASNEARRKNIIRTGKIRTALMGQAAIGMIDIPAIGGFRDIKELSENIDPDALTITKRGFISSSNVVAVTFDPVNNLLFILFKGGALYEYKEFPFDKYKKILRGESNATTNDIRDPKRWWKGKFPSVGAAVWEYIRRSSKWGDGSSLYRRIK